MPARHLESDLEEFFRSRVRAIGGMSVKLIPVHAGMPDRLVLLPGGGIFLVELKTETGGVREIQKVWHEWAASRGVKVHVLRGRGEVLAFLRDYCDTVAAIPRGRTK